jgi:hypothetical protein
VTALGIVLAHLVGDYLIQSHWMAVEKVNRWWPAVAHGLTYTLPYALVTQSLPALAVIAGTHIVIDRYRLAKHVVWFKNQFAPKAYRPGHTATGYPNDTPPWLAVWLLIIADNVIHLLINAAAVILL